MKSFYAVFAILVILSGIFPAQADEHLQQYPGGTLDEEVLQLKSELQAMSHGFYSQSEWQAIYDRYDVMLKRAEMTQRDDLIIKLSASRSLVLGQALSQPDEAIRLLENVLRRYKNSPDPELRRIYVQLADLHADLGDEPSIVKLIEQYRSSPLYDPQEFTYEGARTRGDPLKITRAHTQGDPSLTVTAMENARKRALQAKGRWAKNFSATTLAGRSFELTDLRGHVVLLDFFHPNWPGRATQRSRLIQLYQEYHPMGFDVISIPLFRNAAADLPWMMLPWSRDITREYQVFGEATTVLIDQDGRIAGRNMTPHDIRRYLAAHLKPEL